MTEDRNAFFLALTTTGQLWRLPSGVTEDRNDVVLRGGDNSGPGWRLPSGVTEDRNIVSWSTVRSV